MKMLTRDGRQVDVPDDKAHAAFLSGEYGFVPGASIPIVTQTGKVGEVSAEEAQNAFANGMTVANQTQIAEERKRQKYESVSGVVGAASLGAARGLSVGLSDPLVVAATKLAAGEQAGEQARRMMAETQEVNPGVSIAGEVAGALAPAVLSGGASAPAEAGALTRAGAAATRVMTAPGRAVALAGKLAEKAAMVATGERAGGALTGIAKAALRSGATGAVEGALYGVGQQVSEDTLGDHELTAEKLAASAGHGAIYGFLTGAALGGTARAGGELLGAISPSLRATAEERAAKALFVGSDVKAEAKIRDLPGGKQGMGRWLLDNGVTEASSYEAQAGKIEEVKNRATQRLDDVLDKLDAVAKAEEKPIPANILKRIDREVVKPLEDMPGFGGIKASVESLRDEFATVAARKNQGSWADFRTLRDWRANIDDVLYRESRAGMVSPRDAELRKIRSVLEDELEKAMDGAAHRTGGSLLTEYKAAKLDYRRSIVAGDAVETGMKRLGTNRTISPSDYLAAGIGAVTGGPGGAVAGLAKGAALGAANHWMRMRGNATAARVLDKIATHGAMVRAAQDVDRRIDATVTKYLESGATKQPYKVPAVREAYDARADEVAQAALATRNGWIAKIKALAPHAPKVTEAMAAQAGNVVTYLADQLPKDTTPHGTLNARFEPRPVTDAQAASFLRKAQVAHDPLSVLDEIHRGTLTKDHVEALKAVSPKLHAQIVEKVRTAGRERKKPLSYEQRLLLGVLLGEPTDATMQPGFVARMQRVHATPKGSGHGRGGRTMGIAQSVNLDLGAIESRRNRR